MMRVIRRKDAGWELVVSAILADLRNGRLGVLTGAGISISAGLPSAAEMMDQALIALSTRVRCDIGVLKGQSAQFRLEPFLRVFETICGEPTVLRFLDVLHRKHFASPHQGLAWMLTHGSLDSVVTLNFDYLIEVAAQEAFGHQLDVRVGHESDHYPSDLVTNSTTQRTLIKLHGTLLPEGGQRGLVASLQAVGVRLSPRKDELLRQALNRESLLVVGYSDDDIDVFPALTQLEEIRRVYWVNPALPPDRVNRWLNERGGTLVQAKAEDLFEEILTAHGVPATVAPRGVGAPRVDLKSHCESWLSEVDRGDWPLASALAAAWIAQDLGHPGEAEILYRQASERIKDQRLGEFAEFRLGELYRTSHRYSEAFTTYRHLRHVARSSMQYHLLAVVERSIAATHRSSSHRTAGLVSRLRHWISAWWHLLLARRLFRRHDTQFSTDSRFAGEKGAWTAWEEGMLWLGAGMTIPFPSFVSSWLLRRALGRFRESSSKSDDVFEQATATFSLARTLYALQRGGHGSDTGIEELLNEAAWRFDLLQDSTGISNVSRLRAAVSHNGPDPWYE